MYRIFADDTLIYDSTIEDYKLGKGVVSLETNKSGSFVFSIYPEHFFYDNFIKLKTIITVYKRGKIVFKGRILNEVIDYWNNKVITCEGELGFLQDSIIRPFTFSGTPKELFTKIITDHNTQVDEFKRFKIGKVTIMDEDNHIVVDNPDYMSTTDNLNDYLLSALEGYVYITHGDDGTDPIPTINYLSDFSKVSSQTIEFGVNLKTFAKTVKAESLCTALIPLGAEIDNDDSTDGQRLTIASVNGGKDFIYSEEAVAIYGWIYQTVEFDDITDASTLKAKGERYLTNNAKQLITIDLTAIDLHLLNPEIESINVCEYVRAMSTPHNFDAVMLCNKQTIDLLKPDNDTYTLGYTYASLTTSTAEIKKTMSNIDSRYVTNQRLSSALANTSSLIEQTESSILLQVDGQLADFSESVSAELSLKVGIGDDDALISMINASANVITLNSNRLVVNSDNFSLSEDGSIIATNAVIANSNGSRSVDISDGTITVDSPWKATGDGAYVTILLMKFWTPFGIQCGLFCRGTVLGINEFAIDGVYAKVIDSSSPFYGD